MKQVFTLPLKLLCSADFLTLIVIAVGQLWSKNRLDGYKYVYTDWAGCFNKSNVKLKKYRILTFWLYKKGYNHLLNSFIKDKKTLKSEQSNWLFTFFYQLMYEIDIGYFSLFEVSYEPTYIIFYPTFSPHRHIQF